MKRRENFARYNNSNEALVQKARGTGKGYFYMQQQYKRAAGCHGDGGTVKIEQWSRYSPVPRALWRVQSPGIDWQGRSAVSRHCATPPVANNQPFCLSPPPLPTHTPHHHANSQRSNKCSGTRWHVVPVRSLRRLVQIVPEPTNLLNFWKNKPTSTMPPPPTTTFIIINHRPIN